MGRTLDEMIAAQSPETQAKIEARYHELLEEAHGLAEVRKMVAQSQSKIAETLHIKQPSVSRMERQADMYLSTLRDYIRAAGGELQLVVRLPNRKHPVMLTGLGDIHEPGRTLAPMGRPKKRAGTPGTHGRRKAG